MQSSPPAQLHRDAGLRRVRSTPPAAALPGPKSRLEAMIDLAEQGDDDGVVALGEADDLARPDES